MTDPSSGSCPSDTPIGPVADATVMEIRFCRSCGTAWDRGWEECPSCVARGAAAGQSTALDEAFQSDLRRIKLSVALYFALLAISVVVLVVLLAADDATFDFQMLLGSSIATGIVVLAWACLCRSDLFPLVRRSGPVWMYPLAAATACGTFVLASGAVEMLNHIFDLPTLTYLEETAETSTPFAWAVLLICIFPAVFEEIAFRGVILTSLERVIGMGQAILVSSLLFAILHLSIASMPHLLVLGLVLGWLRFRSGSIFPSVAAHFLHNFLVILTESQPDLMPW